MVASPRGEWLPLSREFKEVFTEEVTTDISFVEWIEINKTNGGENFRQREYV